MRCVCVCLGGGVGGDVYTEAQHKATKTTMVDKRMGSQEAAGKTAENTAVQRLNEESELCQE